MPTETGTETAQAGLAALKLGQLAANTTLNWCVLLAGIFAGFVLGRIAATVLRAASGRLEARFGFQGHALALGAEPAKLAVLALGLHLGLAQMTMSAGLGHFCRDLVTLLIYLAGIWYAYNLVEVVERLLKKIMARTGSTLDDMVVPIIRKALRVFVVVVGALLIADNVFGQDIGAWLAGLGIAGLAVSLAAQDSLKNLFGSITILFDRPFKVGERIRYKDCDGVVEEIGLRSTKVRTLEGNLMTVPNSNIVNDPVENLAVRPYIRRVMNLTITYDTPREKILEALHIVKGILEEPGIREPIHGKVKADELPPRVFFNNYNADSLNIFAVYWYMPPEYWDYMEHGQRVNLRIFEEFAKAGIEFAFPTQTLYLAGDPKRRLIVERLGGNGSGGL